jgi:DNA-binding SARP family transcriptional activator/tetratricopeptide (TPR) repeat protein
MRPSHAPHARKPLRLLALGGASLVDADGVVVIEQRRRLALLVLIAGARRNPMSRDKLVAYLSPESPAESARHALHQLLYYVRQQAGDDVLLGTDTLRLNSEVVTSDVTDFEDALDRGDLTSAVGLYRGPFLDGFHLNDSVEFDVWADNERSRLAELHADATFRLATAADDRRDHAEAIRWWSQLARLDPLGSRAAFGLIRAHVAARDVSAAFRHAAAYESAIRTELDADPDPDLRAYVMSLRANARVVAPSGEATTSPETLPIVAPASEAAGTEMRSSAPKVSRSTLRRLRVPIVAVSILSLAVATAWSARSARPSAAPVPPPVHDSLRLRIVTASVQSDPGESTLALRVRNAVLAEMAKDPWLFVVTPEAWAAQAPLIGLADTVLALPDTIRRYARKTRTHAIVDFSLSRTGPGFVITAEARSARTDSSLGVIAKAGEGAADLPNAMDQLGRALRERLVAARSTLTPTEWSLNATDQPAHAIELFVEARSEATRSNFIEASRRAKAAVAVDSTFAQAWRLLHSSLSNAQMSVDEQLRAISAAYRFRERVRAPFWRLDIVAAYHRAIGDYEGALVFYDSIARIAPVQNVNAGMAYGPLRRYELGTRGYRRYVDAAPKGTITPAHPNLVTGLLNERKIAEAKREVASMMKVDSTHARTFVGRSYIFTALRQWDSLAVLAEAQLRSASSATDSAPGLQWARAAAIARGQFALFDSMTRLTATLVEKHGSTGDYLAGQLTRARMRVALAGDTIRARAIADSALAVARWESHKPMDRPYVAMLLYLASIRDLRRGAEIAAEWSGTTPKEFKLRDSLTVLVARAELLLAANKPREAVRLFRLADVRGCEQCFYPRYARAFDAMGESDSARVWFERYTGLASFSDAIDDAIELPHTYRRLGGLAEARGNTAAATGWYERFIALWAESDMPSLQAQVRDARERVNTLRAR